MADKGNGERQRLFCRNCGTPLDPEDTFCSYCGKRLEPEAGISAASRRTPARSRIRASDAFSRLWPANAGREILAGFLVAVAVAGLIVGLVYALLALRGVFADPSTSRALGLVVFSLIHGGAISASVPASPSLLGIGGSLELGLPVTSFALLPFAALLVLSRIVARRTETTILFACATAIIYALVVGVLAAFGGAFAEGSGEGAAAHFAAEPLSTAWRAFLLAILGALLGAAVSHGPLLPVRPRQVIRGAFAAIGISLAVTVLLTVILLVVQGGDAPTQQITNQLPTQVRQTDSPIGGTLTALGVLFALLPALLSGLWIFAHGLPMGLQGAEGLTSIPLIGSALADVPLQVSLLGNWPGRNAWRLLLVGPVVGLVVGGMVAGRGAPRNERWWQGALTTIPYAAVAAIVAVLCRITAELSVAAVTLNLAFGVSLPWLLALLPVGGAFAALGGLLAKSETVWTPNPRRTFLAAAIVSGVVLIISLPSAVALPSQRTSDLASSDLPASESSPKTPVNTPEASTTTSSSDSPSDASPDPAFTPLLPTLQKLTTAPIILPTELPAQLKNVAIGKDESGGPYATSEDKYAILFLAQPPRGTVQPYVHASTVGTLTASPQPRSTPPSVTTTSRGTATLPDGTQATLQLQEGPEGSNMGTRSVGTFEENGLTYTLDLPAGGNYPSDLAEQVLSTMVSVPQSDEPSSNPVGSEASLRQAVKDYYEAVDREDWKYTYDQLDSQTRQRFTETEWRQKNQYYASNYPLQQSSPTIGSKVSPTLVNVVVNQTFKNGTSQSRDTYFVYEDGSWKHRFSDEEIDLFMAGTSFEQFKNAR